MAPGVEAGQDLIVVMAEVVKAVGLKGEVKLYPLLDFHAPVLDSPYLRWEDGSVVGITGYRPAGNCVVLKVDGSRRREDAEALVGRRLGFRRADYLRPDFPRPTDGMPFRWLGRAVVTTTGEAVGTVEEVRWTGGQHLLVIVGHGREALVPAVPPILRDDDRIAGDLVIDPPPGLLDVQAV